MCFHGVAALFRTCPPLKELAEVQRHTKSTPTDDAGQSLASESIESNGVVDAVTLAVCSVTLQYSLGQSLASAADSAKGSVPAPALLSPHGGRRL